MPLLHNRLPQNQWYKAAIILLRSQILWVGHSDKTQCGGGGAWGTDLSLFHSIWSFSLKDKWLAMP